MVAGTEFARCIFVHEKNNAMGEAELIKTERKLYIRSIFHFYGDAASNDLAFQIANDIARHWNADTSTVTLQNP